MMRTALINRFELLPIGFVFSMIILPGIATAKPIVFRNDAKVPISFSLRNTGGTEVATQTLEVGGKIQFDLPEDGRFDICAKGLDQVNGTFGRTSVDFPTLLASSLNNEVGVDGILCRGKRTAILLKFPLRDRCCCCPYVLKIVPAGEAYVDWFYNGTTIREPDKKSTGAVQ